MKQASRQRHFSQNLSNSVGYLLGFFKTAPSSFKSQFVSHWLTATLYVLSVFGALTLSALLIWATDGSWQAVFSAMLDGSLLKPGRWGDTIGEATPLLLVALGTVISNRAGLINIGQEGQLLIGAAATTFIAVRLAHPGPAVLLLALLGGVLAGAFWSWITAGLKYWRRVPEVLTTLLLVTVAAQLAGYSLKSTTWLLDPTPDSTSRNQVSETIPGNIRIPRIEIFGNEFPISAFVAVAVAGLVALWLTRTAAGFRLRMLGQNPTVAHRVGVSNVGYGMTAMAVSGGFAGLAGAMMITGGFGDYKFVGGFSSSIGWEGLLVALVARNHPVVAVPMAFVFGGLSTSSDWLKSSGVKQESSAVVQALLVLALLLPPAIMYARERRNLLATVKART